MSKHVLSMLIGLEELVRYVILDSDTKDTIDVGSVTGNTWLSQGKSQLATSLTTDPNVYSINRVYAIINGSPVYTAASNFARSDNVLTFDSDWFTTTGNYTAILGARNAMYYNSIAVDMTITSGQQIMFTMEYTFNGPVPVAGYMCASRMGNISDNYNYPIDTIRVNSNVDPDYNKTASHDIVSNVVTSYNSDPFSWSSYVSVTDVRFLALASPGDPTFALYNTGFAIPVSAGEEFYVQGEFTFG